MPNLPNIYPTYNAETVLTSLSLKAVDIGDVNADLVSCTTLMIDGEPLDVADITGLHDKLVSLTDKTQNLTGLPLITSVTGDLSQTNGEATFESTVVDDLTSHGDINQEVGWSNLQNISAKYIEVRGGDISQLSSGTTTLLETTVASLDTIGDITQSAPGVTSLQATSTGTLTAGTITQTTGATATLKETTVNTLTSLGNITLFGNLTQSTGTTATLKATTVDSLACSGSFSTGTLAATTAVTLNTYPIYPRRIYSTDISTPANSWESTTLPTYTTRASISFSLTITLNAIVTIRLGGGSVWNTLYSGTRGGVRSTNVSDAVSFTTGLPLGGMTGTYIGRIVFEYMGTFGDRQLWAYNGNFDQQANTTAFIISGTSTSPSNETFSRLRIDLSVGTIVGKIAVTAE